MAADGADRESLFDCDAAIGLFHRIHDRLGVQRTQTAQVDDFRTHAHLGQLICRFQRIFHADAEADQCDVIAFAPDARLAKRHGVIGQIWDLEALAIENFILQKDHRVWITNG